MTLFFSCSYIASLNTHLTREFFVGNFYLQHEYWFAVFQLVTAMLGMGATLTGRDFPGPSAW